MVGGAYQKLRPGTQVEDSVLVFLYVEKCERMDFREAGKVWDNWPTIFTGDGGVPLLYLLPKWCLHPHRDYQCERPVCQCMEVTWISMFPCFCVSVLSYTIHPTTDRLCTTSCDRYTLRSDLFKSLKILLDYTHYLKGCLSLQKFLIFSEGPLAVRWDIYHRCKWRLLFDTFGKCAESLWSTLYGQMGPIFGEQS